MGDDVDGALGRGVGVAGNMGGDLAKPAEELGAIDDLAARLVQRLSHFQGHKGGEVVGQFDDAVVGGGQQAGAGAGGRFGPRALGGAGGVEGGRTVGLGAVGDLGEDLPGCRIEDVKGCTTCGVAPFSIDEHLGGDTADEGVDVYCGHGFAPSRSVGPRTRARAGGIVRFSQPNAGAQLRHPQALPPQ